MTLIVHSRILFLVNNNNKILKAKKKLCARNYTKSPSIYTKVVIQV